MRTTIGLEEVTSLSVDLRTTVLILGTFPSFSKSLTKLATTQWALNSRGSTLAGMLERTILPPRTSPPVLPTVALILAFSWSSGGR